MDYTLSFLGVAMLMLLGVAVILAVMILILYEAHLIVRLGRQLSQSLSVVDEAGLGSEPLQDENGGA